MMIKREDVEHVAMLARLELSEADTEKFTRQLNDILQAVDKLKKLDTANVEPTAHAAPMKNVFRPDKARLSWPQEAVLANAPDPVDGFFRVPKIMEG
ncbi:MAG: Asp-tRNA(Asn)/Glu-tRNA(Gln) amidotransferase subunit GatC [Firmicutes bacterium]|nr:Asp-tRNA(Asn)/Glu-tRNA(Gln) amidotransferase subunit GatC [Bacillota bacterium]